MTNLWIEHVKQYAQEKNLSYKDALSGATQTYHKQGGNFISNIIYKPDKFKPEKMNIKSKYILNKQYEAKNNIVRQTKKPKKNSKEPPKKEFTEEEILIQNWNDPYLGTFVQNTKYGKFLDDFFNRKAKKNAYIVDFDLLSFFKSINNDVVKKYGSDALFNGIDKIVDEFMQHDEEKYIKYYGYKPSLAIRKYVNKQTNDIINKRSSELYNSRKILI
jgi:hypothetical protein